MTVPPELVWLIERLRTTTSRSGRLRLLLGAWKTLSGLGPADRLAVARELGFDGAERLVEEMARRKGFDAEPWVAMLDEAERTDDDGVASLVRGLADPQRRRDAVARLVDRLAEVAGGNEEALPPETGEETAVAAHPSEPTPPAAHETTSSVSESERRLLPVDPPPAAVSQPPGPRAGAVPEPPRPTPRPAAPKPQRRAAADRKTAPPAAGSTAARPTAEPPPAVVVRPPTEAAARSTGPTPEIRLPPAADRLLTELGEEPRLLARLRRFAEGCSRLAGAEIGELRSMLELFPDGWARRRALDRLFEAGLPPTIADAAALVALLDRPSDRVWAIRTLAASRALDDTDRGVLLAAEGSPEAARRLNRAFARH